MSRLGKVPNGKCPEWELSRMEKVTNMKCPNRKYPEREDDECKKGNEKSPEWEMSRTGS